MRRNSDDLEYTGAIFQTTIDSEVIAYHIARERLKSSTVEEAVGRACRKIKGAYSLVVMSPRKLVGARDPYGFKPLCIGKRDNAYILASETLRSDTIGAEYVRDVLPGDGDDHAGEWNCLRSVPRTAKEAGSEMHFSSTYILQDRTVISTA